MNLNRRRFLVVTGLAAGSAGCTGGNQGGGDEVKDSDGDGVIDSADYAPNDPEVQEKSDIVGTARTEVKQTASPTRSATVSRTPSPTATRTPTATPPQTATATPQPSTDRNSIAVDGEPFAGTSYISEYGFREVSVLVNPESLTFPGDPSTAKVAVLTAAYPVETVYGFETSDSFSLDGEREVTVTVDQSDTPTDSRLAHFVVAVPGDETAESASDEQIEKLHETDPFRVTDGRIARSPHPRALSDDSGTGFERQNAEGTYLLNFSGRTNGKRWRVGFYIYKSGYIAALNRSRGRSRQEYVAYEQQEGFAGEIADILSSEAEANDITDPYEQVEFVIDVVQNLPYIPDDVSKGYDDYTKFSVETLVECGGDCEDTAILMAGALQSDPFGYDVVLIQPPGHMAVGIYASDRPGYYWTKDERKYYYIETTGAGWGIGDCPEEYQSANAYVYQV